MPKVFISYRRADTQHVADRLYDTLERHLGDGNVFQDVDRIPIGVDFVDFLRGEVEKADIVLVLIGPDWARILGERADLEDDFVRIEVEQALSLGKIVIPVLLKNARMPSSVDLPESVRYICRINAAQVRPNPDWKRDSLALVEGIQSLVSDDEDPTPSLSSKPNQPTSTEDAAAKIRAIIGDPFDLCDVPAGEFIYGGDPNAWKAAERQVIDLPAFTIAKYPITYRQFNAFLNAPDGYRDAGRPFRAFLDTQDDYRDAGRWFDGLAADGADRRMKDQEWSVDDHPRENVNWYGAMAFCRWLSFKLGGLYDIGQVDRWRVRLPTEFEWEKAARGTDGLFYPYGNDFDKSKGNTEESGIKKTTPVTQYPAGASPYGVMDMSGNVFEWCLSDRDNPQVQSHNEDITYRRRRVLRGGAWRDHQRIVRAASRGPNYPEFRNYSRGCGFRVLVLPHLI